MVTMQTTRGGMDATQIFFFFWTNSVINRSTTQAEICTILNVDLQSRRLFHLICMTIFVFITRFHNFCCSDLSNLWLLKTGPSSRCLSGVTKWKFLLFLLWVLNITFCRPLQYLKCQKIIRCFPWKQFTNHDLGTKLALERRLSFSFLLLYLNKKK